MRKTFLELLMMCLVINYVRAEIETNVAEAGEALQENPGINT